ncbi:MAG: hypothetical protein IIB27_01465 [Chloroflexi bacterium]|nr:hypothetical protein [Chloroflexota bacterium]
MPDRTRKRPVDINELAKSIVDEATSEDAPEAEDTRDEISKAAAALGRRGGLKGGPARAAKLTKEQRTAIAKKAAKARWNQKK